MCGPRRRSFRGVAISERETGYAPPSGVTVRRDVRADERARGSVEDVLGALEVRGGALGREGLSFLVPRCSPFSEARASHARLRVVLVASARRAE